MTLVSTLGCLWNKYGNWAEYMDEKVAILQVVGCEIAGCKIAGWEIPSC